MPQHALEQLRIAVPRHDLVGVREVPIVAAGPKRHATRDRRVELRGIQVPLLAGVVPKELVVQLAADFADDDILGGTNGRARLRH